MNKCIFLDRDGVLNKDYVDYAYTKEKFQVLEGVPEAISKLKSAGYKIIIITNQSGIAKGIYKVENVMMCHEILQEACGHQIDDIFYARYHESVTASLTRKPDSLMFEKAIYKWDIDINESWMIGDKERDLIPANKVGITKCIQVDNSLIESSVANKWASNLLEAVTKYILA